MRLDYKRDLSLDKDRDKAEVAKDVSGLANAQGGWLLYGIDEDDSDEPRPKAVDELRLASEGRATPDPWLPLLTIVVAAVDGPRPLITPDKLSPDAFPESCEGRRRQPPTYVRPSGRWILDAHGLHQEDVEDELVAHRVAIFRQGVFEWARRYRFDSRLQCRSFAEDAHDVLGYAATVFAEVGYFAGLPPSFALRTLRRPFPKFRRGGISPSGLRGSSGWATFVKPRSMNFSLTLRRPYARRWT